jgi:LPXTG-motif cell wall-anchored protein
MMASLKVRSGEAAAPEEMPIEDAEMMAEPTGGGGMLLPMIGLLMVGGIGFFVWKRKKG